MELKTETLFLGTSMILVAVWDEITQKYQPNKNPQISILLLTMW